MALYSVAPYHVLPASDDAPADLELPQLLNSAIPASPSGFRV